MNVSEYRQLIGQGSTPSKSKYRNVPTTVDGIRFDSKAEAKRYGELLLLQRAGAVMLLARQVRYELLPKSTGQRAVVYVADFTYTDTLTGKTVIEDVKGTPTPVYRLKKRLMKELLGLDITEIRK